MRTMPASGAAVWRRWRGALATALLGWLLAAAVCIVGGRRVYRADRERYERSVSAVQELLETHMEKCEGALARLQSVATYRPQATGAEWLDALEAIYPAVNFRYLAELGVAKFHGGAGPNDGDSSPGVDPYMPVIFRAVGPQFSAGPVGDDLAPDGVTRNLVVESAKTAAARLSESLVLTNAVTGRGASAVRMLMAYYVPDPDDSIRAAAKQSPEDVHPEAQAGRRREAHFAGVVFGTVMISELVRSCFGDRRLPVEFELHAGADRSPRGRVDGRPFRPEAPRFENWCAQRWYTRDYWYRFYTTSEFEAQSPRRLVWASALGLGSVFTALAAYVQGQNVGRLQAESIAALREERRRQLEQAAYEKEGLSRDLHDGAVQTVFAAMLSLKQATQVMATDQDQAHQRVHSAIRMLDRTIAELRNFLVNLAPTPLSGEEFVRALATLVHTMDRAEAARVRLEGNTKPLLAVSAQTGVELLYLWREAISNAVRHAAAKNITLRVSTDGERVQVEVIDDGSGFDLAAVPRSGQGLANMRTRAARLGANLQIVSSPGAGTTVRLAWKPPLPTELT